MPLDVQKPRQALIALVRPLDTPIEVCPEPMHRHGARFGMVIILAAVTALALTAQGVGGHGAAALPPAMLALLGACVIVSLRFTSAGAGDGSFVNFSTLFTMGALLTHGMHWTTVATGAVAVMVGCTRIMRLSGGPMGVVFNGATTTLLALAVGHTMSALEHVPLLERMIAALAVGAAIEIILFVLFDVLVLKERVMPSCVANVRSSAADELYLAPLTLLGAFAMKAAPSAMMVAMLSPAILAYLSTRSQEHLAVARHHLGIDGMTGLLNRTRFWAVLDEEFAASERTGRHLWAIMLDIDNFKNLNDTHGHLEGDRALIAVADALRASTRRGDVVARYGGEEFGVVVSDESADAVIELAERIRAECGVALAPWGTTMSIGVADRKTATPDSATMLAQADDALYVAKHLGKNRVQRYSGPTELGDLRLEAA